MNRAPVFLLVEPSPIVASALGRWLENAFSDSQVVLASNGTEAIQLATENIPSHVLIELSLPDKAGIEILVQLRRALPASRIIATSWFQGRWLIDGARSAGADGFVNKDELHKKLLPLWKIFIE
ncbi:MAG TPA: response regulator transcription factor [Anaerolineales bacterium]|jgi:DNA-binding NarL/FixJ family response regulator|nr:response regulator transcription factor [Anaerolineales bacterium]